MSELRNDPVTGRFVLVAPGRSARPHTVTASPPTTSPTECPFCPGHEDETPTEVARTGGGAPGRPGWRIRVVPNLYPIVGGASPGPGGGGVHEVVVFGPDHTRDLGRLDPGSVVEVFHVLRDRARAHAAAGLAHVQVLVNHGRSAGASIAHPHAQVLAIEFSPPAVVDAIDRFTSAGRDLVVDDAAASIARGEHVLTEPALVWCPWAAASPFETRIAARETGPRFEGADDDALDAVALATRRVVAGIERVLGTVAYNVIVHNGLARDGCPFHWYVTVMPRVATVAGFEMGTGVLVNTVTPADAAALLREANT